MYTYPAWHTVEPSFQKLIGTHISKDYHRTVKTCWSASTVTRDDLTSVAGELAEHRGGAFLLVEFFFFVMHLGI